MNAVQNIFVYETNPCLHNINIKSLLATKTRKDEGENTKIQTKGKKQRYEIIDNLSCQCP